MSGFIPATRPCRVIKDGVSRPVLAWYVNGPSMQPAAFNEEHSRIYTISEPYRISFDDGSQAEEPTPQEG